MQSQKCLAMERSLEAVTQWAPSSSTSAMTDTSFMGIHTGSVQPLDGPVQSQYVSVSYCYHLAVIISMWTLSE